MKVDIQNSVILENDRGNNILNAFIYN